MSNIIYSKQNSRENQELIVAQHYVYRNAKVITLLLFLMSVVIPIGFNILMICVKNDTIITIFSFISICFVILSDFLRNILSDRKNIAAQIQQKFDIAVFELKNGFCFDEEGINWAIEKYNKKDWKRKKDWYPDYRKLDKNKAVFYCQKENIDWSNSLSHKYVSFLIGCLAVLIALSVVNLIVVDYSISHIISLLIIALPLFTYCYSGFSKIKNDNKTLNTIINYASQIETLLEQSGEVEEITLQNLQWMIFNYRKVKYLIPDWFDKLHYKKIENHEIKKAKARKKKCK